MLPTTEQNKNMTVSDYSAEGTSRKDFLLPRIVIAQASSDLCKEGLALPGQLVSSLTKEKLADKGVKFPVLPIACTGTWNVTSPKPMGGGFADFIRKEPITPANDDERWQIECFEGGAPVVHHKILTFLMLPVNKLDGFPFFMDFRGGNKDAAKLISTIMQENNFKKKPGYSRVIDLSTRLKTYKSNSWFVTSVQPVRDASQQELDACAIWFGTFVKAELKAQSDADEDAM